MYEQRPWNYEELEVTRDILCNEIDERVEAASTEVPFHIFLQGKDNLDGNNSWVEFWFTVAEMVVVDYDEWGLHVKVSKMRQIIDDDRVLYKRMGLL